MADLQTASCDVCGVIKGAQNHWFRVWNASLVAGRAWIIIATWDAPPAVKHSHCCGEQHALRKAAELLAGIGQAAVASTEPLAVIAAPSTEESSAERVEPKE